MILNLSKPPFEIGARRVGCLDGDGKWQEQPYVLIRETTQDEWIAFCRAEIGPEYPTVRAIEITRNDRFFEVATD